jgi:hypothetical protein
VLNCTSRSISEESQTTSESSMANISQNFRPVTLTVNVFFKQESDKLSDEDLFKNLAEMKKTNSILNRKFRSIPGNLKVSMTSSIMTSLLCHFTYAIIVVLCHLQKASIFLRLSLISPLDWYDVITIMSL